MKRRRAREYALQILFQLELTGSELSEDVLKDFWKGNEKEPDVRKFTLDIVKNTRKNLPAIDEIIKKAAENWDLERMAVVDRNILRAATYELASGLTFPVRLP